MWKIVRNSVFTVAVVALTAFGLKWNKSVTASFNPFSLNQTVAASQSSLPIQTSFPLTLTLSAPQIRLGQTQTVSIATVPNAELEIVTQYPDGSINHPQSLHAVADGGGNYTLNIAVDDFHNLGAFRVSVVAISATKTAEAVSNFVVTSWQPTDSSQPHYLYPLVP